MTVLDTITAFLTGKGFTRAQIAGIEGNLKVESGLNPSAYNAREGAIGLAQWEGPRRTALQRYAAQHGSTETDLGTQLGFMWFELRGSEQAAYSALVQTDNPSAAAVVWDQKYERSAGTSRSARIQAANDIYRGFNFGGGTGGGTFTPGGSGDSGDSGGGFFGGIFGPGFGGLLDVPPPPAQQVAGLTSSWGADAMTIGLKILGTGAAAALVVVGVMHTVKDGS